MIADSALVEPGAQIGHGTFVWHRAHVRSGATVATMSVNWVSPVKERRLTVTGTRGALWASWSGAMDRTRHPTFFLRTFDGEKVGCSLVR